MPDNHDYRPLSDAEWPEAITDLREDLAGGLNVYRVMAHHPALLKAWQDLREHVVNKTSLGKERSEVVILRTGVRHEAGYEWAHHVVRGRKAGLSDERIASLKGALQGMTEDDALLADAVDQLLSQSQLDEETVAKLARTVGREGIFDVMATVGFYTTLAFVLKTFDTPIDQDIIEALMTDPSP